MNIKNQKITVYRGREDRVNWGILCNLALLGLSLNVGLIALFNSSFLKAFFISFYVLVMNT